MYRSIIALNGNAWSSIEQGKILQHFNSLRQCGTNYRLCGVGRTPTQIPVECAIREVATARRRLISFGKIKPFFLVGYHQWRVLIG